MRNSSNIFFDSSHFYKEGSYKKCRLSISMYIGAGVSVLIVAAYLAFLFNGWLTFEKPKETESFVEEQVTVETYDSTTPIKEGYYDASVTTEVKDNESTTEKELSERYVGSSGGSVQKSNSSGNNSSSNKNPRPQPTSSRTETSSTTVKNTLTKPSEKTTEPSKSNPLEDSLKKTEPTSSEPSSSTTNKFHGHVQILGQHK